MARARCFGQFSRPTPHKPCPALRDTGRVSFLDNLENNLKSLEERDSPGGDDRKKHDADRRKTAAAAPWAEQLKKSPWTQSLMQQATRAGYAMRTKVNLSWYGSTLRLQARGQWLNIEPLPDGIVAIFAKGLEVHKRIPVDLKKKPDALVAEWMKVLTDQKRLDEANAEAIPDSGSEVAAEQD